MRKNLLLPVALLLLLFAACKKADVLKSSANVDNNPTALAKDASDKSQSGHIKIAVVSDIHYLDQSLIENGAEAGAKFQASRSPNRPVLFYSDAIFRSVIADLKNEHPDIVLVSGDMTKDGEEVDNVAVAGLLKTITGAKVYVVPGNHDILNANAVKYSGDITIPVPNVSPDRFKEIYSDLGYGNDPTTERYLLNYIAKPYPDLWILAIDARNPNTKLKYGTITPETLNWIKEKLSYAKEHRITVLGFMHYNLLEHFKDQAAPRSLNPNTVIADWQSVADTLIARGLQVMFTGHNHATDITSRTFQGSTIYDIETGSLVSPPSPYRILMLKNKELDIDTRFVTSIDKPLPDNASYTEYSHDAFVSVLSAFFPTFLQNKSLCNLSATLADSMTPLATNAYMAHLAGDEKISPAEQERLNYFANKYDPAYIGFTINGFTSLWTDLGVKDHKWHIKLEGR